MSAENWSVYLILCENGALYCGISNRPPRRQRREIHAAEQTHGDAYRFRRPLQKRGAETGN